MSELVPIVDYLILDESPYLRQMSAVTVVHAFLIDEMLAPHAGESHLNELRFRITLF